MTQMATETQTVSSGRNVPRAATPTAGGVAATVAATRDVSAAGAKKKSVTAANAPWIVPAKIAVFIACLYPLGRLVLFGFTGQLGANPIEFITRSTGLWTLVFLCITLAVTPLRKLTGFNAV